MKISVLHILFYMCGAVRACVLEFENKNQQERFAKGFVTFNENIPIMNENKHNRKHQKLKLKF